MGDETPKVTLAQRLDKQLAATLALDPKSEKYTEAIDALIQLGGEDQTKYVEWYEAGVASAISKKDSKRQLTLELIARRDINADGFEVFDEDTYMVNEEGAKELERFCNAYAQIVELHNASGDVIENALGVVTSLAEDDQNSWGGLESPELDRAIFRVYDAAVKGVKKLPEVSVRTKGVMFGTLLAVDQYGRRNWMIGKMMKVVSDNYFGAKQHQGDFDGFAQFTDICITADYTKVPVAYAYALMDAHPDYFTKAADNWVKAAHAAKGKGPERFGELLDTGSRLLVTYNSDSLARLESNSHSHTTDISGISKEPILALGTKYRQWADEKIAEPIEGVVLSMFDEGKRTNVVVEETDNHRGRERHIRRNDWETLNRYFTKISSNVSDRFCMAVADKMVTRLDRDFSPFHREMAYGSLGIGLSGVNDRKTRYGYSLQEHLIYEPYALGVRGLAGAVARDLELQSPAGNQYWRFMDALEKANKQRFFGDGVEEITKLDLTGSEKLVLDALRIVSCDVKYTMSLMPDRRFPGQTFTRTYYINEATSDGKKVGDRVTIDVTPGINYRADKEYSEKGRLVREKVTYSEENRKDGRALHRMWHNAFLFLAYTASQHSQDRILHVPDGTRKNALAFKNFIAKFLEKRLRFSLFEMDGLGYTEYWGEKYNALIDLYSNVPYVERGTITDAWGRKSQGNIVKGHMISDREHALAGVFWGDKYDDNVKKSQEIYGAGNSLFQIAMDIDIKRKDLEMMKAGFVQGVFNTAGNRGFTRARDQIGEIGESYTFSGLLNNPYKQLKFIYDIDLQGMKDRQLKEEKDEWQARAEARAKAKAEKGKEETSEKVGYLESTTIRNWHAALAKSTMSQFGSRDDEEFASSFISLPMYFDTADKHVMAA